MRVPAGLSWPACRRFGKADGYHLMVQSVVVRTGKRLFGADAAGTTLEMPSAARGGQQQAVSGDSPSSGRFKLAVYPLPVLQQRRVWVMRADGPGLPGKNPRSCFFGPAAVTGCVHRDSMICLAGQRIRMPGAKFPPEAGNRPGFQHFCLPEVCRVSQAVCQVDRAGKAIRMVIPKPAAHGGESLLCQVSCL